MNHNFEYKASGNIVFYPKKYSNKAWSILNCEVGIIEYYGYWMEKMFDIKLQKPKHGAHITVIREEQIEDSIYDSLWEKDQNKEIQFDYSNKIQTNGEHFWLPIKCDELLDIRGSMGLVKKGRFSLHMTVGRLRNIDMEWFDLDYFNYINGYYDK